MKIIYNNNYYKIKKINSKNLNNQNNLFLLKQFMAKNILVGKSGHYHN